MQLAFGSGALWGERVDVIGSGIGPQQFGVLQDVHVDFDFTLKELHGQQQFPVAVARGQGKVTGKSKFARILGRLYSDIFFGTTPAAGQLTAAQNEAASVPASTPYTVNLANAAAFSDDLGVVYAATGAPLRRVASGPTAGQYTANLSTGVYGFAAADANAAILVSYLYTVAGSGSKITISNLATGTTPVFKATLYSLYQGQGLALRLNACVASKLSLPTKIDDFTIDELDFSAFADAAGTIGTLSTVE